MPEKTRGVKGITIPRKAVGLSREAPAQGKSLDGAVSSTCPPQPLQQHAHRLSAGDVDQDEIKHEADSAEGAKRDELHDEMGMRSEEGRHRDGETPKDEAHDQ